MAVYCSVSRMLQAVAREITMVRPSRDTRQVTEARAWQHTPPVSGSAGLGRPLPGTTWHQSVKRVWSGPAATTRSRPRALQIPCPAPAPAPGSVPQMVSVVGQADARAPCDGGLARLRRMASRAGGTSPAS